GFDVATLAGNHVFDRGAEGIEDTIAALRDAGVVACGAGADLREARKPALIERVGWRVAVLSYNCGGPEMAWAGAEKAGCAYIRVVDPSGALRAEPALMPGTATHCDEASLQQLREDIGAARRDADIVVVAFHKGALHTPAVLLDYERPLARAAIDAG